MDKNLRFILILGVMLLVGYTAFQIYTSISGGDSKFRDTITEIQPNLGDDVIEHINNSSSFMVYYENVDGN